LSDSENAPHLPEEQATTEQTPEESVAKVAPAQPARQSRLRRFFLRHLPLAIAGLTVLTALALTGLYYWASSPGFENMVRGRLIARIESATGGKCTIASFHWKLLSLEAEAGGVILRGTEDAGEVPLAQIDKLRVRIAILGLLSPHVVLRELEITRPRVHLIVYPDGSTNQPSPKRKRKAGKSGLEQLFEMRAGVLAIEQGELEYENRASGFDYQNRYALLDLTASDTRLKLDWLPPSDTGPERYRIEAAAKGIRLSRGGTRSQPRVSIPASFSAQLDLRRAEARLDSLTIHSPGHTLTASGILQDFTHPHWQGVVKGEFDAGIVEPVTGYPDVPVGVVRLDLNGAGQNGRFQIDGGLRIENGAYLGSNLNVRFRSLDGRLHLDGEQFLLTQAVVKLNDGGSLEGSVNLAPWLPGKGAGAAIHPPGQASVRAQTPHDRNSLRPVFYAADVPMTGKVVAQFKNVTLDGLMDIVAQPGYRRLGLATVINGPATANWEHGDANTLTIGVKFGLTPLTVVPAGEIPAIGALDGVYAQQSGAVDVKRMELHTSSSNLQVTGSLGVNPVTRPTQLNVNFNSRNLGDLDSVLRTLGLEREGRKGTAALPAALKGMASFDGNWSGSLLDPHLSGRISATTVSIEIPSLSKKKNAPPRWIYFDQAEASGSYSAQRIVVDHGLLRRGEASIALDGSIAAASAVHLAAIPVPEFNGNSLLRLHLKASKVPVKEVLDLAGSTAPVTGWLDAKLDTNGPANSAPATGWVELDRGTVWGEPVARLRAQGSISAQQVKVTNLNLTEEAGKATAAGSYEFSSGRFTLDAHGAGIDTSRIAWLRTHDAELNGKLAFTVKGQGTAANPFLEARATLSGLALAGEPVGKLEMTAHAANRQAVYDLSTRLDAAEMKAHGQTGLDGDYPTQVQLQFSRFNIDALLKAAHVKGLSGESALAGTVTLDGPLAKPDQLRGEARIAQMAVTVSGVKLASEGGLHATLRNNTIQLDPLHITGDQTDMRAQGSLSLKGQKQLDLATSGSINLKIAETLDPDLTASGVSTFQLEAHGPLANPELRGRLDFRDGALALEDVPNGLSQIRGTLEFNRNRLEVRSLTAMSGGGLLTVGGYLSYQKGLYADLTVAGKGIRVRYPQGVSSMADLALRLEGPQNYLLLSGGVQITRFSISPELDIASLALESKTVKPTPPPNAPSNHIRLDVHLTSSPQLNFQNAYAKLAGNVDLRVRGTVASPSLLGRISVTEGSAILAGTRYELQRGEISFTNPVRIQPNIDLNATARVEDYDITLGLHGTPDKFTAAYRSDPPLPEADVLALLALGRRENQQRIYARQQEQAGATPATDALLGGALNATVSSRVRRLFGAGAVKVDPNYLGALGNSTSRITVESQVGQHVTLTYATNVNTTAQQLVQADVVINRHISLQMSRDESGVFSMVLKATRRFR
jgi:translocation and assembly module TamB